MSKKWSNYHSHCNYCDGKSEPEDYARRAIELNMIAYGFSSHGPVPFDCEWTMKKENISSYKRIIQEIKEKHKKEIQIYCGLEIDYVPGVCGAKSDFIKNLNLDYTIGSVHFVNSFKDGRRWEIDNTTSIFKEGLDKIFGGDIREAIKTYFSLTRKMVNEETPDIVGHLDKIKMHNIKSSFFSEKEDWYRKEIKETLEAIKESKSIIEVNTRGFYKKRTSDFYPSNWILEEVKKLEIPVMLNSDCHTTTELILGFEEAQKVLTKIGFKDLMIFYDNEWKKRAII